MVTNLRIEHADKRQKADIDRCFLVLPKISAVLYSGPERSDDHMKANKHRIFRKMLKMRCWDWLLISSRGYYPGQSDILHNYKPLISDKHNKVSLFAFCVSESSC